MCAAGPARAAGERPVDIARKASPIILDPGASVGDAFATIARSTLEHLQANEQGVLAGEDPEFLHQLRVGLRRLRSALSAFSRALPEKARKPIVRELKWLAGGLGAARDWDVMISETLPAMQEALPQCAALVSLGPECARLQAAAQRKARRALSSRKYQRMMDGLGSWIVEQAWRNEASADELALLESPLGAYARDELERRHVRVRKRGRKLSSQSAAELHDLRIAVKKLRYTVDFFAALYPSEPVASLRSRVSRLQQILGALNDAATTMDLLGEALGDTDDAALLEARGLVVGWSAGRADALKRELSRSWRAFRQADTFW